MTKNSTSSAPQSSGHKSNPERSNGKASKKHRKGNPVAKPTSAFGYGAEGLQRLAAKRGISVKKVIEELAEKRATRRDRRAAARTTKTPSPLKALAKRNGK